MHKRSEKVVEWQTRVIQTYVVNFVGQKVQMFWPDYDYMGEINI